MVTQFKVKPNTVKHIEAELFEYHDTLKRIHQRRVEIMSDPPRDEGMPSSPTLPSSNTEKYATRLVMDRQLLEDQRIVGAIEHVYNICDEERRKLIGLKYWTRPQTKTWEGIAQELNVSRRQAFRWRDEIVHTISEKLGWR